MFSPRGWSWSSSSSLLIVALLLGIAALVLGGSASAQVETTSETIKTYTTNDVEIADADNQNATLVTCSVNNDFSTWELHYSEDQGTTFDQEGFFNGSATAGVHGDKCKVDVSHDGQHAVAVINEDGNASVAVRPNQRAFWSIDEDGPGIAGSTTAEFVDVQIKNATTWIGLAQYDSGWQFFRTDDGGSTYTNHSFASDTAGGSDAASLCTVKDGDFEKIFAILPNDANQRYISFRSRDGGGNWTGTAAASETGSGFDRVGDTECLAAGDFNVYHSFADDFSNNWQIFRSQNEGDDWTQVHFDSSSRLAIEHEMRHNSTTGIVAKAEDKYVQTTDGSSFGSFTWADVTPDENDVPFLFAGDGDLKGLIHEAGTALEIHKEEAPAPRVVDQTEIFGNAGTVRTDWRSNPNVYVLDTTPDNSIWYGDASDLSGFAEPKICDESDDTDYPVDVEESAKITGMDVSSIDKSKTWVVSYRCFEVADSRGAGFVRSGGSSASLCIGQVDWCPTDQAPIRVLVDEATPPDVIESREANELLAGYTSGTDKGSWAITKDGGNVQFPGTAISDIPDGEDYALEHKLDNPLIGCAVSSNASVGVRCVNEDGSEITNDTDPTGQEVDVYDNQVWVNNGSRITRFSRSGSSLVEEANNTANPLTFHGVTKDGQFAVGTRASGGEERKIGVWDASTLELIVESENITDTELNGLDVDFSNNYGYTTSSTTLFKVDLFNFTSSQEGGAGIIGQENPEAGTEETVTDDGTTNETTGSAVTDLSAPSEALGISESDFAVLMSAIAVFTFGGGAMIASTAFTNRPNPVLGATGALAGAALAVAYGWMPGWLLLLTVLVLTGAIVLTVRS